MVPQTDEELEAALKKAESLDDYLALMPGGQESWCGNHVDKVSALAYPLARSFEDYCKFSTKNGLPWDLRQGILSRIVDLADTFKKSKLAFTATWDLEGVTSDEWPPQWHRRAIRRMFGNCNSLRQIKLATSFGLRRYEESHRSSINLYAYAGHLLSVAQARAMTLREDHEDLINAMYSD